MHSAFWVGLWCSHALRKVLDGMVDCMCTLEKNSLVV